MILDEKLMISNGCPLKAISGPQGLILSEKKLTFFLKLKGKKMVCNWLVSLKKKLVPMFEWVPAYGGD